MACYNLNTHSQILLTSAILPVETLYLYHSTFTDWKAQALDA